MPITFNKHVVLDSQIRKTNHLNSISITSTTSFSIDGMPYYIEKLTQLKAPVHIPRKNRSREELPYEAFLFHLHAS